MRWSAIRTVCRKEVVDNARDRRTLMTALVFGPLFGPFFFAIMINVMVSQNLSSLEETLEVPVIGAELAPNLTGFLTSRGIEPAKDHTLTSFEDAREAVSAGELDVVLLIEEGFAEQLSEQTGARIGMIFDQSNSRVGPKLQRIRRTLGAYSQQISTLRLVARGINPAVVRPFIIDEYDVSTATGRSVLLLGMLTYFLLLATLMGGLSLAIDTTAGERERKSLEPLLTLPVTRPALLAGKMLATVCFMLLSLVLTLASFTIALEFLPLAELGMSSAFGLASALTAFAIIAPFVPLGAAIMTLVASFTKTYKEAQGYLTVVLLVPTLPLIFASIMNVRPSLELMLVPSLGQHLLVSLLIRGEPVEMSMWTVASAASLFFGAILTWIAMRLYEREGILG